MEDKKTKEALFCELDELEEQWGLAKKQGDTDGLAKLAEEVFCIAYDLIPYMAASSKGNWTKEDFEEVMSDFFIYKWKKYDPERGRLYPFISENLKLLLKDRYGKERKYREMVPMDALIDEDGEMTRMDTVSDQREGPEQIARFNDDMLTFLSLHFDLSKALKGRANNPDRILYYRMFFTDNFVSFCREYDMSCALRHERDVFEAMRRPFLDFFMRKQCRTIPEIAACELKPYGEMVAGREMKTPRQPLPNDVYRTYLNTVEGKNVKSDGTISNQRGAYEAFLKTTMSALRGTEN